MNDQRQAKDSVSEKLEIAARLPETEPAEVRRIDTEHVLAPLTPLSAAEDVSRSCRSAKARAAIRNVFRAQLRVQVAQKADS